MLQLLPHSRVRVPTHKDGPFLLPARAISPPAVLRVHDAAVHHAGHAWHRIGMALPYHQVKLMKHSWIAQAMLPGADTGGGTLIEGALGILFMALWGYLLFMSIRSLASYTLAAPSITRTLAAGAAGGGVYKAAAVKAVGPGALLLRALAATLGVGIGAVVKAAAATPAFLMAAGRLLLLVLAGSLLQFM